MTRKQIAMWSLVLTAVIELTTIIMRFGLKMQSTRDTASTIGVLTHGIRIHHGYIGVIVVIIALSFLKIKPALSQWMIVLGTAFVCSDLVHHFLVLWPIVGSPQFDFVY